MGIITNLIRTGMEKRQADQQNQLRAFEMASQSDDPQLRQWGIQSVVDMGKKHVTDPEAKKKLPVLGHFATILSGMNPMPKAPGLPEGQAPKYSPERAEAYREAQAAKQTERKVYEKAALDRQVQQDTETAELLQTEKERQKLEFALKRGQITQEQFDTRNRELVGVKPEKGNWSMVEVSLPNMSGKRTVQFDQSTGQFRSPDGRPYVPPAGASIRYPDETKPQQPKTTTVTLADGTVVPALERDGQFTRLDGTPVDPKGIKAVGAPVEPKLSGALKTRVEIEQILNDPKSTPAEIRAAKGERDHLAAQDRLAADREALLGRQTGPPPEVKPNTPQFRAAQDLAYGKLTFGEFKSLYSYSRDVGQKLAIYEKARELNPNFEPARFEADYKFSANPKVRQQIASMDNVQAGMSDLLKLSDAATRTGITALNKYIIPGGILMGGKRYANFHAAQIAFADELSGALGFGSATDMSRTMGKDMTNPNLSPEDFRGVIQEVISPFVDRKRKSLLDQMGVYGQTPGQAGAQTPGQTTGGSSRPPLSSFEK